MHELSNEKILEYLKSSRTGNFFKNIDFVFYLTDHRDALSGQYISLQSFWSNIII